MCSGKCKLCPVKYCMVIVRIRRLCVYYVLCKCTLQSRKKGFRRFRPNYFCSTTSGYAEHNYIIEIVTSQSRCILGTFSFRRITPNKVWCNYSCIKSPYSASYACVWWCIRENIGQKIWLTSGAVCKTRSAQCRMYVSCFGSLTPKSQSWNQTLLHWSADGIRVSSLPPKMTGIPQTMEGYRRVENFGDIFWQRDICRLFAAIQKLKPCMVFRTSKQLHCCNLLNCETSSIGQTLNVQIQVISSSL